ncbi:MAG: BRCT domain-containing protein [Peptostreptococcaceae bacterium]
MINKVLAIYFETIGTNKDSVSSIGLALYENKKIVMNKELPINLNVDERKISYFPNILNEVISLIDENTIVISPNATFDINVLRNACDKYEMEYPIFEYLCTWKLGQIIYNDEDEYLEDELELNIKTPKEEALACIKEYERILSGSSYDNIDDLLNKYYIEKGKLLKNDYKPFGMRKLENILFRKNIVFTGGLSCMRRAEAFKKVKNIGGVPSNSVSKNTHYLVIGDQGIKRFSARGKSSKMISAERLVSQGYNLKILTEDEFLKMI